jgi:hypothetical protein
MSSTCFKPEGSSSGKQLYMQLRYGTYACNCIYNRLPEDEPSGLKHVEVEDIKIKN